MAKKATKVKKAKAVQSSKAYCSIVLDRQGEVLAVLDAAGKPVKKKATAKGKRVDRDARVGEKAPNGEVIKEIINVQVVVTGRDADPCYIHDRRCNFHCVCANC